MYWRSRASQARSAGYSGAEARRRASVRRGNRRPPRRRKRRAAGVGRERTVRPGGANRDRRKTVDMNGMRRPPTRAGPTGGRSTRGSPRSASPEFLRVPPAEAVAAFRAKGRRVGFDCRDTDAAQHARSFTVAKAMRMDILEDVRAAVDEAIAEGLAFEAFQERLEPTLRRKGRWGRRAMTDPRTGETRLVRPGSPRRLRIVFDTDRRTACARRSGQWASTLTPSLSHAWERGIVPAVSTRLAPARSPVPSGRGGFFFAPPARSGPPSPPRGEGRGEGGSGRIALSGRPVAARSSGSPTTTSRSTATSPPIRRPTGRRPGRGPTPAPA